MIASWWGRTSQVLLCLCTRGDSVMLRWLHQRIVRAHHSSRNVHNETWGHPDHRRMFGTQTLIEFFEPKSIGITEGYNPPTTNDKDSQGPTMLASTSRLWVSSTIVCWPFIHQSLFVAALICWIFVVMYPEMLMSSVFCWWFTRRIVGLQLSPLFCWQPVALAVPECLLATCTILYLTCLNSNAL